MIGDSLPCDGGGEGDAESSLSGEEGGEGPELASNSPLNMVLGV